MFKHVHVTLESLENERTAAEMLGWSTGAVFNELVERNVVREVNWQQLDEAVSRQLEAAHWALRQEYREGDQIRDALRTGKDATLQDVKARLLQPLLTHLNCLASGVPNSLSNWITAPRGGAPGNRNADSVRRVAKALTTLAAPVVGGIDVCRSPSVSVSSRELLAQKEIERDIEGPMIPQLLAGEGPFAGPKGYVPYLEALKKYRNAYEPANRQLKADWLNNKSTLFRLRDAAEKHLWGHLHGEWIPELMAEPHSASKFARRVHNALRIAPIANLLQNKPTRIIVGGLTAAAAWKALEFVPVEAGDVEEIIRVFMAGVGASAYAERIRKTGGVIDLGVFYQQSKKIPPP
ncbi:hypothetical protein [Nonomuraea africana]|uniref:hypothetical protein n=1 Tax=Nonomuraea africana TaxID=46171 RepID=UPI00340FDC75